jgi:hypothetical protein
MSRWASFTLRAKSAKIKKKKDDITGVLGKILSRMFGRVFMIVNGDYISFCKKLEPVVFHVSF